MTKLVLVFLILFNSFLFGYSTNNRIFASWIERICKPFDKDKLTVLPLFTFCQRNVLNVSNMLKYEELPEVNSERWLSLEDFEGEIWKDAVGYEGTYQVSNYGRVKSVKRLIPSGRKYVLKVFPEKILRVIFAKGYCKFNFCKNGVRTKTSAHRMVALAFIPNPENLPQIDHIDGNKLNNIVFVNEDSSIDIKKSNLRWCDAKTNMNNPVTIKKMSILQKGTKKSLESRIKMSRQRKGKMMGSLNHMSKPVVQMDIHGNIIKTWICASEAARVLGFNAKNISACCLGNKHTHHGYTWRHLNNND